MITIENFIEKHPGLETVSDDIKIALKYLVSSFSQGGGLFVCGNGEVFADSLHIVGELQKSFNNPRSLSFEQKQRFKGLEDEEFLVNNLENGLRAHSLVSEIALITAVSNDIRGGLDFRSTSVGLRNN